LPTSQGVSNKGNDPVSSSPATLVLTV